MPSTILCVDDDPNYCRILARAFREQGHQVVTAQDGENALDQLQALQPQLITLDVMLPRRDGFSVLEEIRRTRGAKLPVVLLSGCRFSPEYEARAKELDASVVLTKPVPLKRLLEVASDLLPEASAGPGPAQAVDLTGTLDELPFPFLLHHLHGLRASGVLRVQKDTKKKLIQLRNGRPVTVRSNMVKETLGHLLVASGRITWDVLHEAVQRVKEGEGLQGQILKAMYMLDDQDLAQALHSQSEEKLLEVFSWEGGTFRFQQGARIRGEAVGLKRSPASLILEGLRQRAPMALLEAYLEDRRNLHPAPSGVPFHEFQDLEIDDATERVLAELDGATPISALGGWSDTERRILVGLVATGLVELMPRPVSQPVRVPRRRARAIKEKVHSVDDRAEGKRTERVRCELTALAERFEGDDPYAMFELRPESSDAEIRKTYAELAHRSHPDRFARDGEAVRRLAEQVFDRVSHAYHSIATEADRKRTATSRAENVELEQGHQALRAELAFQQGQKELRARHYGEALRKFAEAVEAYPEEGEYHAAYGWALHLANPEDPARIREAKRHALYGKKLAPERSAPLLILGRLCKAQDKIPLAEQLFTRAVELDPDCSEALQELRLIALRRERGKGGLLKRILRRSA
ncbi:MAG: hypothetical protein CL910_05465 [Deltaproteobacteria bacterium]|nr:hypothetical protein [Deltaproteobacteria bacterium]